MVGVTTPNEAEAHEADRTPASPLEQARPHMPVSFVAESNYGGIPITVCGCGVLLMTAMAETHAMACPVYLAHAEGVTS